MDNLTLRRWLAFAGIAIITAGMISIIYGIVKNDYIFQLLGLIGVIVAYALSLQVKKLRKDFQAQEQAQEKK